VRTFGTFASRYDGIKVYFVGCVDCPIVNHTLWRDVETRINTRRGSGQSVGVKLALNPSNKPVTLRIAISHVSIENAKENLDMETQGKDFDTILADAKARWEENLGLIPIEGGSDAQRTVFYSALYRSFQMPTLFTDVL
jgi:putative alpha-1,2-mannosidase